VDSTKPPEPTWTWVRFGDVVRLNTDRCTDPVAKNIERYVGMEHIEPEDLRIRRWGMVAEGTTFTNRFRPGQVLFGKRRAYQRKVAVADFEGVCSSDIYVFESKDPAVLLPELLPFICQTESFFEHAVGTSAGSLSPRTNWTQLAAYEFALPPLEEQRRIAEVLWATEAVRAAYYQALSSNVAATDAHLDTLLRGYTEGEYQVHSQLGAIGAVWPVVPIGDLLHETQYGLSAAPKATGQYPVMRMTNIVDGEVVESDLKYVDLSSREFESYRLYAGDVLFNRTNSHELVGRTGVYMLDGRHVFASYLVRIRVVREKLRPDYLVAYLNAPLGRRQVMSFATKGVSQANVNASNLAKVLMPLPPLEVQETIMQQARMLRDSIRALEQRAQQVEQVQMSFLESVVGRDVRCSPNPTLSNP
jgi:type I restriction enzyme S subunit